MFFAASKVFWGLAAPSHVIIWCALAAALLLLTGRRRTGTGFAVATALLLFGLGVMPSFIWLGQSLESRFDATPAPTRADGILVLGGGFEDIHRLPVTYMLARRYPNARVVYSSGSGSLLDNQPNIDSLHARDFLIALGLNPARIMLEGHSRNTYENLVFSRALIKPSPSETWILVTSAYHMPRAMEIADKIGWRFVPVTSDRVTPRHGFEGWFNVVANLKRFEMLTREHIGLLVYRLSGHSRAE